MVIIWYVQRVFHLPQVSITNRVFTHTTVILVQIKVFPLILFYRLLAGTLTLEEHKVNLIYSYTVLGLYGELLETQFWWENQPRL
jgi:hypothetical protein